MPNPNMDIIPENETKRIAAVRRYEILDTPPDGAFDRITAIAARRFGVPIAIVSIVDTDRIWFKSHHGLPVQQIDREPGLRSEEHTSELQSLMRISYAVFCLKKTKVRIHISHKSCCICITINHILFRHLLLYTSTT